MAPSASVQVLTKDERNVIRDALRSAASRDARSADYASSNPQRDGWVKTLREHAATATRLADLIADGAEVEIRPCPD